MRKLLIEKLKILNAWRTKHVSNKNFIIFLAFLVGIVGGLAAAILKGMTHSIAKFLQDEMSLYYKYSFYLIFPLIGILLSVLYVRKFLKGKKFEHGITPIIYSVSRKSSRIEFHNIYSQIVTSALTVGFGGSSGLEAPIAYSGSAIGSNIARFFGLTQKEVTLLLACGAAAGIAGAFNSPVAGMVFAIELLLTEFAVPILIPLLISSAIAAAVSGLLYDEPLFYITTTGWAFESILFYLLLAVFVGLFTVYFSKLTQFIKTYYSKVSNPYNKVWFSGISLGILIFIFPALYGEGYITIQKILDGNFNAIVKNSLFSDFKDYGIVVLFFSVLTLFGKSFASLITVNSGGNGGIFGPSLVMGGLLGFVFSYSLNLTGWVELNVPNFVMAGMAGALAGIMHAPLTSIFLIAEITGGYMLMIPLMLVASISYLINKSIMKYSIYTKGLADSGDLISYEDKDRTVLSMLKLRYLLETNFVVLNMNETPKEMQADIIESKRNIFPVVDDDNNLIGVCSSEMLFTILLLEKEKSERTFASLAQAPKDILKLDEDMDKVMQKMNKDDIWILPVIDKNNKYQGFISKAAVFNKYRALLMSQGNYLE